MMAVSMVAAAAVVVAAERAWLGVAVEGVRE